MSFLIACKRLVLRQYVDYEIQKYSDMSFQMIAHWLASDMPKLTVA
jgi:hypothetical protein